MERFRIRSVALLCGLLAAVAAVGLAALLAATRGDARPACTHGLSSIGPVVLRDGKIVGGDTTPHTEACLSGRVLGTVPGTWPS